MWGITIRRVTIYVPVTALAAGVITDMPIKFVTTVTDMVTTAIIMRRDITTDRDTPGRAAIDITGRAAAVITEAVPIREVTIADKNSEMFLRKCFEKYVRRSEIYRCVFYILM